MMTSSTSLQSLPPPLALRDADRVVGWIEGDTVRFGGFGSKEDAAQAAVIAHEALVRRLARAGRETPSATNAHLGILPRGVDRPNPALDDRPVARVRRSHTDDVASRGTIAYELAIRVPAPAGEIRMRAMAYVMYRAICNSGIAWPLLHPDRRVTPVPLWSRARSSAPPVPTAATTGEAR